MVYRQTGIPEQFLWYVMKALTAACEAMTYNVVRAQGEIVHLDLNPNNGIASFSTLMICTNRR